MKPYEKRAIRYIIAITLVFPMSSCTGGKPPDKAVQIPPAPAPAGIPGEDRKSAEEPKKAVSAKVNGVPIAAGDLVDEMNAVAPEYLGQGRKRDAKIDEKIRKEALNRLIYRELAVQQAKKEGMKAPAGAVAEEMKRIKTEEKTEEAFRQRLAKSGMTEEELRRRIERNLLVEMITEKEVFGKAVVNPDEARKVYEKKANSYKGPSGPMTFEEARPLIDKELMTAAVQKREDEWVAEMKKGAKIEIAP